MCNASELCDVTFARPYRIKDISGQRFGRLLVISICGRDKHGRSIWLCQCDCGVKKEVPSRHLVQGNIRSCGCLAKEIARLSGKKGGHKISGSKSHLYNKNLTDQERFAKRNLVELRKWRTAVYERDGYKCGLCGNVGGRMQAHHLDCWARHSARRFDVSNGVTLCKGCHKAFHESMGGARKPCTEDDFQAFKSHWYLNREIRKRELAQQVVDDDDGA